MNAVVFLNTCQQKLEKQHMKPANLTNICLLPQNTQCSVLWRKMSFLSRHGPKRATIYGFGGRTWTHGVIWSPLCVTTLLVY